MQDKLQQFRQEVLDSLKSVKDINSLRGLETKYLGRKGELTRFLRGIAKLEGGERKKIGKLANEIKNELLEKFKELRDSLESTTREEGLVDVTLPGKKIEQGHLHPITTVINELEDLFTAMGFMVLDGPELESDYYNFKALNIPEFHPARDIQDTFYVEPPLTPPSQEGKSNERSGLLMRTHTSPMQVRAMQKYGAPFKCVVPGRVFRHEATDACHDSTFYNLEGLMIGEDIAITHLISVMKEIFVGIFKKEVKIRVRPGYFPFVEPGIEVDMRCMICGGQGCPSCKNEGWVEMIGAGMVHPKVIEFGGIDPKKYGGFAFGLGVDRLAMMRYGINDIRLFHSGDLRFLQQL
jgi:phenylalanyl-tRNA synthetase alpha chain